MDRNQVDYKTTATAISAISLLTFTSCKYLDYGIASSVSTFAVRHHKTLKLASNIPDLLPEITAACALLMSAAFMFLRRADRFAKLASFSRFTAIAIVMTYIAKSFLKYAIGRINTRYWLKHRAAADFLPFAGNHAFNSFPSGHMAVLTALVACCWLFYPRWKNFYAILLSVLAFSLVLTNFHFLGDIFAGALLGYVAVFALKHSKTLTCGLTKI